MICGAGEVKFGTNSLSRYCCQVLLSAKIYAAASRHAFPFCGTACPQLSTIPLRKHGRGTSRPPQPLRDFHTRKCRCLVSIRRALRPGRIPDRGRVCPAGLGASHHILPPCPLKSSLCSTFRRLLPNPLDRKSTRLNSS